MSTKTLIKVFRVYAKYKENTIKGGSGYDLISSREELFKEFDVWENLAKPKLLDIRYYYDTLPEANGVPYWELRVIYQTSLKEEVENFEDIIRRLKELSDWNIIDAHCKEELTLIFTDFFKHGSMDKLRQQWLSSIKKTKKERKQ